ncbi:putative PAS sensor histidine kinase/response regulator [Aurantimonas manganoxydans SI85-9A1]|uniref:histidine kinase n=1 Tax=Aurantimonas manganoxydans (strain ATCC BAA-1229 / DSM 21871 / SI85-9A1) TaxID=287752 RepID=Q1YM22_AURMS|nr:PAS domain S-box protein [Aurantimonas manganoxydans]EAS51559.1 putative PAS sensor histidine kinase/response regulator [Aurantimonas manganoxydans SI85-9A1]
MTDQQVGNASTAIPAFLAGGGATGECLRTFAWADTPLGAPQHWPTALKTLVGVMLSSNQAMFIAWGRERTLIYNDAYSEILASKHPAGLGRDFLEVWQEIRADLVPIVDQAYAGEPVHMDDITLHMQRRGYLEETHFSFSYTPVRDETGAIAGFFCPCNEITGQVLAERRLRESEARAKGVLDGMGEGFALLDREFRVIDLNVEAQRIESRPREELVGHLHWELYPGTEDSELGRQYKKAMSERVPVALEYRHVWPDGRPVWVEARAYPVEDGLAVFFRDVTEQKQTEAVARETAERYRLAVRATNDAIWDWHFASNHVLWNEALETAYGHKPEDVEPTGEWWIGRIHPEDRARVDASIHAAIDGTETSWVDEYRFLRADGSYADVLDRGHVIRDDSGQAVRMLGAMLDLTEQRRNQAALRESETRFRTFAEALPLVLFTTDADGRYDYTNPFLQAFTGMSAEALAGFGWSEALHPDDRARALAVWDERRAAEEPFEIEYRLRRDDGVYRWFLGRCVPARAAQEGAALRWIGTCVDMQDIVEARDAKARQSEDLERLVAERTADRDRMWRLSTDLMLVARFDGTILATNPAWTTLLGWDEADLVGTSFLDLIHPDDTEATQAEAARLSEGLSTLRFENRYRTRDGSYVWLSWTAVPDEQFIHAVARDVNAEKDAAAELERAQEALRQSQKMEAVGQLTGGLAHDFNNLLAGISGSLDLMGTRLAQGRLSEADRYLVAAQGAAKRAAALTHRLLAFSRRQTLDPKPTNTGTLISGMEELIRRTVGPAIGVESVGGGGVWSILVDPNQLENALLNLCINARDAMPDGGKITIETANRWLDGRAARERDLAPGQYISLCVSDNGSGMTPDVVEKAFDPFFTTKPIGMGTGLGLSMIYGFARQSGGQVRIYSELGQGTMVCIYLPRYLGTKDDSEDAAPPAPAVAPTETGRTVLVIDDEPLVRMLVVDVLEELGYTALEAGDGPSGMKVIESEARIDLLITDVGLPNGMNGRQVAEAARQIRAGLKVLFITGYAENAVLNHGHLEHGMQVVTKPFDMGDLTRRIQAILAED